MNLKTGLIMWWSGETKLECNICKMACILKRWCIYGKNQACSKGFWGCKDSLAYSKEAICITFSLVFLLSIFQSKKFECNIVETK